jgi:hypothetical protein
MLLVAGFATVLSTRSSIEAVLGVSAALLLGLIWRFLIAGSDANGDSPRFPRPSRVLLVLGFNLLAMVALTFYRVSMSSADLLDTYQTGGDRVLGGALLLGALIAAAQAVLRGDDPVSGDADEPAKSGTRSQAS